MLSFIVTYGTGGITLLTVGIKAMYASSRVAILAILSPNDGSEQYKVKVTNDNTAIGKYMVIRIAPGFL